MFFMMAVIPHIISRHITDPGETYTSSSGSAVRVGWSQAAGRLLCVDNKSQAERQSCGW